VAQAGLAVGRDLDPGRAVVRTVDRLFMRAPVERVFAAASNVERWPQLLRHYR
jgi:hypothetical protein